MYKYRTQAATLLRLCESNTVRPKLLRRFRSRVSMQMNLPMLSQIWIMNVKANRADMNLGISRLELRNWRHLELQQLRENGEWYFPWHQPST